MLNIKQSYRMFQVGEMVEVDYFGKGIARVGIVRKVSQFQDAYGKWDTICSVDFSNPFDPTKKKLLNVGSMYIMRRYQAESVFFDSLERLKGHI